jgi:hypothetical protein
MSLLGESKKRSPADTKTGGQSETWRPGDREIRRQGQERRNQKTKREACNGDCQED